MDLLDVVKIDEAIDLQVSLMEKIGYKKKIQMKTCHSLGYVLAKDLISKDNLPCFRKSTMDGYAINYKDSLGATDSIPSMLKVVEEIQMGHIPQKKLKRGEASKIYTGGMVPEGADAVLPIEFTEILSEKLISISKPVVFMENIIDIGDDSKVGDIYEKEGKIIDPETIAMVASLGYEKIEVYDKLKCKILSTGDEIIPVNAKLVPGKSRDINSYMLYSLLKKMGIDVLSMKHLEDDKDLIKKELEEDLDLIIISGSSSKGNKDFVPEISKELNPGMIYHGISIKPGKPTSLSQNNNTMILGLPGNPISAYAVFRTIFQKAYEKYFKIEENLKIKCKIKRNIANTSAKTMICLVEIKKEGDELVASPIFGFSNNISLLKKAKGYIVIDEYVEGIKENEKVWVNLIR
ncbi:MAG: molybdopterin molybdotransferase MoeA [Anaerococcus vaginalis]|uniref:molybdopterin molybdotransferase MoeA n=1 Tax=Anaerococcus vaginalis TaxID=33037 RepID=UPI00291078DD|nr:molybdopterin molybdotransferase MoeA [Anaerococcus vaginalis]MDU7650753.1 molybdopterin molybdotransferase MoeA [Anaerococcus vaginalis]